MLVLPETCNMYIFSEPPDRALTHKYHFYSDQSLSSEPQSLEVFMLILRKKNVEYFLDQLYLNAGVSRVSNHGTY